MEAHLADGTVLQFPDETPPDVVQRVVKQHLGVEQEQPKSGYGASDALAPWDALLHVGSGALAGPVSGLAGLAASVIPGMDAANTVRSVQEGMTYQPRTKLGGQLANASDTVLGLVPKAGDWVGQKATDASSAMGLPAPVSAAVGTGANVLTQSIPAILGSKGSAALRESAVRNAKENSVKNATMRESVDAGYTIPISELAQGELGKTVARGLESFGGKTAIQQDASTMNNKVVTDAMRKDIGIPEKGQITADELDAVKQPHFYKYEQAGGVSPTAAEALDLWRKANAEAKRQRLYYRKSFDPKADDAAKAAQADAENYMSVIENEARRSGKPELVAELKNARVELGKIGTVENALNESTGIGSANSLRKAQDRGVPIKGGMEQAANFSRAFKNKLTQDEVVQPGVSKADAMLSTAASILKGPKGLALTGVPFIARKLLLARALQQTMKPPTNINPILPAEQMKRAALISALQQQGSN